MGLGAPVMSALYWLRRDGAVGVQYTIAGSSRYAPSDQTRCAGSAIVGTLYEIGGKEKYGAEKYGAQKIRGPKNTKNTKKYGAKNTGPGLAITHPRYWRQNVSFDRA